MLILLGSSGDLGYLRRLIEECGFTAETVAAQDLLKEGWRVEYLTFRMTIAP